QFNANRSGCREKLKRLVVYAELHRSVTFHALFSWQAVVLAQVQAGASPNERLSTKDGRRPERFAHIVRTLRITQYACGLVRSAFPRAKGRLISITIITGMTRRTL